jgi:hypothetical protein
MKVKILLSLLVSLVVVSLSIAQTTKGDTTWIPGGTFAGAENAGMLEQTINGDVDGSNNRLDTKRVYALYEGQVYYQLAPINVTNPTGTLTIVGVPDPAKPAVKTKPIIVMQPTNGQDVTANVLYGSLKIVNVHWQTMELDGNQQSELFYLGTANKLPQRLDVDNCLFEFSNTDIFDATNESGAIGGWPNGAIIKITNSYFRNMFQAGQWWSSRVFQCKHPTDTLWIENCTTTTGGLTFLQQNQLTDFCYINHNTIINQKKYWLLSPYRHWEFITNNIFVNQNWVGEDTNVTNSGQDPDKIYMSTINIDTNNITNGLLTEKKYWLNGDSTKFVDDLQFPNLSIFISNNINYNSPELASGYYNSSVYKNVTTGTIPSYLNWFGWGAGPWKIGNTPGEWMNSRTKALFTKYAPPNGKFVEDNTITTMPQTTTSVLLDANTVTAMAQWNQNAWGDPNFTTPTPNILSTAYIYGDYDPTTLPGLVNGVPSDNIKVEAAGTQVGITKFTDLKENFWQTHDISTIDGLSIGAQIWNDNANKAYNSAVALKKVMDAFKLKTGVKTLNTTPTSFALSQNYPNPFNPTTNIKYSIPSEMQVSLKVYDILGREVASLVNEKQVGGSYQVNFDASKLASGVYIYRLDAGTFVQSKKMILIK